MRKSNGFRWKALSQRQKQVLSWWTPQSAYSGYNGIIADGAIRSGKTFAMSFSFVQWAMTCYNGQQFAMCGKTIASFRRNVLGTLKQQLAARGYNVKEHRAENCMTVSKGGKTNEFYFFGGKDESSQDLIQGITLAGAFFDEVALMPQSFVNQATARCSVTGSKFWFNCNPGSPQHWFYLEWVRKCRSRKMMYLHFTMDDNLSLSEDIKARYRSQVIVDPSALPLITELRKNGFTQTPANNDVLSGILDVQTMLQTGRLKIYKDCKHTLEEFGVYAWDPDKDDTVLKVNDHCMDAIRYFVRTKRLVKLRD